VIGDFASSRRDRVSVKRLCENHERVLRGSSAALSNMPCIRGVGRFHDTISLIVHRAAARFLPLRRGGCDGGCWQVADRTPPPAPPLQGEGGRRADPSLSPSPARRGVPEEAARSANRLAIEPHRTRGSGGVGHARTRGCDACIGFGGTSWRWPECHARGVGVAGCRSRAPKPRERVTPANASPLGERDCPILGSHRKRRRAAPEGARGQTLGNEALDEMAGLSTRAEARRARRRGGAEVVTRNGGGGRAIFSGERRLGPDRDSGPGAGRCAIVWTGGGR
jgi:hypothetical protein